MRTTFINTPTGTDEDDEPVEQGPLDHEGHRRRESEESHQHAQAATGLDHAHLQAIDVDDVALGDGRHAERL
jgi:hypothetical protein